MDRVNAVCRHPLYISKMNTIRQHEKTRVYCCHDMEHLMDVARIMYIRALEERIEEEIREKIGIMSEDGEAGKEKKERIDTGAGTDTNAGRDLIYAAALLHDIGRADQYENGTPHDEAGAETAGIILKDCGFDDNEINLITGAISGHRGTEYAGKYSALLKDAGKYSALLKDTGKYPPPLKDTDKFSPLLKDMDKFAALLKDADKKSRLCFKCEARDTCKWPDSKKNMEIEI